MNLSSVAVLEEDQLIFNCSSYFLSIFCFPEGIVDSSLSDLVLELGPSFHGSIVEFWESTSQSDFQTS